MQFDWLRAVVKFAERKSPLLQNNNGLKILHFVQSYKVTPPLHHPKSKWHLIQPSQREIYKKPTLISYILVRSKNLWSRITLYRLVRMCLACQHFDFNIADWISDNLHVISSQTVGLNEICMLFAAYDRLYLLFTHFSLTSYALRQVSSLSKDKWK